MEGRLMMTGLTSTIWCDWIGRDGHDCEDRFYGSTPTRVLDDARRAGWTRQTAPGTDRIIDICPRHKDRLADG